jgi:hypothetical protein
MLQSLGEKVYRFAIGGAVAAIALHIFAGAWSYVLGISIFAGLVGYAAYRYGSKIS